MGELFATCNCRRAQLNEAETVRFGYYRTTRRTSGRADRSARVTALQAAASRNDP